MVAIPYNPFSPVLGETTAIEGHNILPSEPLDLLQHFDGGRVLEPSCALADVE